MPINRLTRGTQIPIAPAETLYVPLSAVSFLGGFRTPAAEHAAPSLKRPASETLPKRRHRPDPGAAESGRPLGRESGRLSEMADQAGRSDAERLPRSIRLAARRIRHSAGRHHPARSLRAARQMREQEVAALRRPDDCGV